MLNLLPLRLNFIFGIVFVCFLVIIVDFASGFELGVSPSKLSFNGSSGERMCGNITLFSSESYYINFTLNDLWSGRKKRTKDLTLYDTDSDSYGVRSEYPKSIVLGDNVSLQSCFTFESVGFKQGILLFDANGKNLKLGVWIIATITENNSIERYSTEVDTAVFSDNNILIAIMMSIQTILLFVLVSCVFYFYKRRRFRGLLSN